MNTFKINKFLLVPSILLLTVSLWSCSESLSPSQYISWVNNPENGLVSNKSIGNFQFDLQYRPGPYLTLMELGNTEFSDEEYKSTLHHFDDQYQFLLRIKLNNGNNNWLDSLADNFENKEEKIKYLSFFMQDDIKLIKNNDTVDCKLYHFERNYGISPYGTFLLEFPDSKKNKQENNNDGILQILFDDFAFSDSTLIFKFFNKDINNIPTLKL